MPKLAELRTPESGVALEAGINVPQNRPYPQYQVLGQIAMEQIREGLASNALFCARFGWWRASRRRLSGAGVAKGGERALLGQQFHRLLPSRCGGIRPTEKMSLCEKFQGFCMVE